MTTATEAPVLLDDEAVAAFVARGYHLVEPDLPAALHESICGQLAALERNPGNGIYEAVPALAEVYGHPEVRGALQSLLGSDVRMNPHRHLHANQPGSCSQTWHQDGTNVRHHQVWCALAMYYPHEVTAEMGPTIIMPGTHFRNAPTDRLATYVNLRGQVPLTVKAGTVAITHYDLWHAASRNQSSRPRYMLKFLFDRQSTPQSPSWRHDPENAAAAAEPWLKKMLGEQGYCSDFYKEWELRLEMWQWLQGLQVAVPAGAFRNMLG